MRYVKHNLKKDVVIIMFFSAEVGVVALYAIAIREAIATFLG